MEVNLATNKQWYQMRLYTTVFTLLTRQRPADMFEGNVRWQHTGMQVRWLLLTSSAVHHYHGAQENKKK